jgi:PKD repeat protein
MRSWMHIGLLVMVVSAVAVPAALGVTGSNTITTIAGTGTPGFVGEGGQATSAQLNSPGGVAVDVQGNVYISEYNNNRIRKVSGGIITTVAGTGTAGPLGDGGQATSAQLNNPSDVAVDAQGNLYIADTQNHKIRKVSGGIITTVAGTGTAGPLGDGGQATSAQLNKPSDVAVDAQGNLYIADYNNNRIRKVSGGIITTVAGTGTAGPLGDGGQATSAQLNDPEGVAVDAQGDLYIADAGNHKIRKVSGGVITTVAGTGTAGFFGDGGQATSAQLQFPDGVEADAQGNLYIADTSNSRVRKVSGGVITTVAGTGVASFSGDGGPASAAALKFPYHVGLDAVGSVYIADTGNHRVRKIANAPPAAVINASPSSGQAPLSVNFDGSQSSDPDGQVVSYSWAFGDGGTGTGKTVNHQYGSAGTFQAKLTVTDDSGASASATRDIVVSAAPPPPPPPPPAKPKLSSTKASFGKATAGKAFTVSFTVKNKSTGKGVRGTLSCKGKLAGKSLGTSRRSTSSSGKATCTWQMPKTAKGKTFAGSISETYKGVKASRSFSTKVG